MKSLTSQNDQIKKALLAGKRITPMDALKEFKCFRLASRISDLRKDGLPIQKEMVDNGSARYAMYYLPQSYINEQKAIKQ
jgi:hypothetical protein